MRVLYERINEEECAGRLPVLLALSELGRRESRETSKTRLYDILIQLGISIYFKYCGKFLFLQIRYLPVRVKFAVILVWAPHIAPNERYYNISFKLRFQILHQSYLLYQPE
jgi:hypothetical protein